MQQMAQQGQTANAKIQNAGYYVCVCFVTEEQRDEFVEKAGWSPFADNSEIFYDGLALAGALGVELTPEFVPFRERGPDKKLVAQVGIIPKGKK